ncbi:hypothetical protein I547_7699 [Mycobacterium kansasii 824]|nr:hypothetical protein I547_7699 [Mycobacterium kansasii 824]
MVGDYIGEFAAEQVVVAIDAPLGRSTIGWPRSRRSLGT